jgi:hypothetical protein
MLGNGVDEVVSRTAAYQFLGQNRTGSKRPAWKSHERLLEA